MAYIEGFIVAVPKANRDSYLEHARGAADIFLDWGIARHVEAWANDVPDGKITDFRKAVQAKEDEDVVFSWFEHRDREARDAFNQRMMSDPRMEELGSTMPFDGKRMIYGGFQTIVDEGQSRGGYFDGFVLPVKTDQRDAYHDLAARMAKRFQELGATRVVEALADDVSHGEVTDFYRAVQAEDGETVVFSFIEWPDKATRDAGWKTMMDNDPAPNEPMPFDGKRMFWGGFDPILDRAASAKAEA